MKKHFLSICLTLIVMATAEAQYTVSTSTAPPMMLPTGAIEITGGVTWDDTLFTIPIPFYFTADGVTTNSVLINSNGYAIIQNGTAQKYLASFYTDLISYDQVNLVPSTPSRIRYQVIGQAGSRILKVEWAVTGFKYGGPGEFTAFQMWLYEGSNIFETHFWQTIIGDPHNVIGANGPSVGVITSIDQNGNITGQFLSGGFINPTLVHHQADSSVATLATIPPSGRVFTFTPVTLAAPDAQPQLTLTSWPNPVTETVHLQGLTDPGTAYIYNSLGQLAKTQTIDAINSQLQVKELSAGVYQLAVISNNSIFNQQLIKQ